MSFPPKLVEVSAADDGFSTDFRRSIVVERSMHAISIVILPKSTSPLAQESDNASRKLIHNDEYPVAL